MPIGQLTRRPTPAGLDSWACGQALQTIAMIRTSTAERIALEVMRDPYMPHLRMQPAVQQTAVDERASADAGAHGDVHEVAHAARSAPTRFGQGGGIYVGIECNRRSQRPLNRAGKVEVPPARFWRGGDVPEGGRLRIRIDGPEGSDSNGCDGLPRLEEIDHPP